MTHFTILVNHQQKKKRVKRSRSLIYRPTKRQQQTTGETRQSARKSDIITMLLLLYLQQSQRPRRRLYTLDNTKERKWAWRPQFHQTEGTSASRRARLRVFLAGLGDARLAWKLPPAVAHQHGNRTPDQPSLNVTETRIRVSVIYLFISLTARPLSKTRGSVPERFTRCFTGSDV